MTIDGTPTVPPPRNEPVVEYRPGSTEREQLSARLKELADSPIDLPMVIGETRRLGEGPRFEVVQPHRRRSVLGIAAEATEADVAAAVERALAAAAGWRAMDFSERAAVFLRAADLLTGPRRFVADAATMLGQSKTCYQAEIDAVCELADFWRFNVWFAERLLAEQPLSAPGTWNRADYRPLEGFVLAITPFNFTSIAGNLPTAPALLGNVVVWKPAPTQQFAAHFLMELLEEAGLPPGVITMVTGRGAAVSAVALPHPELAGVHFTGSTATFAHLWRTVAENLPRYRNYPRLVGETGGKDFVVAHPSADLDVLVTALIRGAFEYQGQKCSAVSRAYLPRSLWNRMADRFIAEVEAISVGDVTDFSVFMGALIDERAYRRVVDAIERARRTPGLSIVAGGRHDDGEGWFVWPTVVVGEDPSDELFTTEYFGPILGVYVYDDARFAEILDLVAETSPYGLTGSVIATDRDAIRMATERLRYAAGNFYINDKPTGAVVGQQPFGGSRASGTNDKAGSIQNLLRWTTTRIIKENFVPPTDYRYPHMAEER